MRRLAYYWHRFWNQWAVVEYDIDGSAQIISTHLLERVALRFAWDDRQFVMRTDQALEIIDNEEGL